MVSAIPCGWLADFGKTIFYCAVIPTKWQAPHMLQNGSQASPRGTERTYDFFGFSQSGPYIVMHYK